MAPPFKEERFSELPTQPMLRASRERGARGPTQPTPHRPAERPTERPTRPLPRTAAERFTPHRSAEQPTRPVLGAAVERPSARPTQPMCTYQPGERAWQERAKVHIALFLVRHPELAQAPHSELVLQSCAELVWELREESPRWSALSIREMFRRAAHQHAYFPQPGLLVALYDVLYAFVAWLAAQQLISRRSSQRLFEELQGARSPLVDDARRQLREREQATRRHGAWYEVLKTLGP